MVKNQLHGVPGKSNIRENCQDELGNKLESDDDGTCGSKYRQKNKECMNNEQSFCSKKAEDGEEYHNKPSPKQPIERTQRPNGSNYSKEENPKYFKVSICCILMDENFHI